MSTNRVLLSDWTLLNVMVSRLQCPFQVDDQDLCQFNQIEDFCPFGHCTSCCVAIPPYICVDYLVGKCTCKHTSKVPIKHDRLARCSCGYHPTGMQLLDLEMLHRKVTSLEQHQSNQAQDQVQQDQAVDDDLKCAVCLQQMDSPFGLLEYCRHVFCAECILVCQETDPQRRCPVCRVESRRVLLWHNNDSIRNEQAKLELFRQQARCINLFELTQEEIVTEEGTYSTIEQIMDIWPQFGNQDGGVAQEPQQDVEVREIVVRISPNQPINLRLSLQFQDEQQPEEVN